MINPRDADTSLVLTIQQQQITAGDGATQLLGQNGHLISGDGRLHLHLKKRIPAQVVQKLLHRSRWHGGSQEEVNCPMELNKSAAGAGLQKSGGRATTGTTLGAIQRWPCVRLLPALETDGASRNW